MTLVEAVVEEEEEVADEVEVEEREEVEVEVVEEDLTVDSYLRLKFLFPPTQINLVPQYLSQYLFEALRERFFSSALRYVNISVSPPRWTLRILFCSQDLD